MELMIISKTVFISPNHLRVHVDAAGGVETYVHSATGLQKRRWPVGKHPERKHCQTGSELNRVRCNLKEV
jgi:hypothetical protein